MDSEYNIFQAYSVIVVANDGDAVTKHFSSVAVQLAKCQS